MDALTLFEKLAEIHNNSTATGGDGPPLNHITVQILTQEIDKSLTNQELTGFNLEVYKIWNSQLYLY